MYQTKFVILTLYCLSYAIEETDINWWYKKANIMVINQIEKRGVLDEKVLRVMRETPRHLFIPENLKEMAYEDRPLPIGDGQTISQPYIVALMTELLQLEGKESVLEIGTGSGYQAAVLSPLAKQVYSIEIIKSLAEKAEKKFKEMQFNNVIVKWGDGYLGWSEYAPFDAIIVTAAPNQVPQVLIEQLKPGGNMVLPVGTYFQKLIVISKSVAGEITEKNIVPVRFVPMVHSKNIPHDSIKFHTIE